MGTGLIRHRTPERAPLRSLRGAAWAGLLTGAVRGAVWAAPAAWMGVLLDRASQGRVQAFHATGTLWNGQATLALGGGPGSGVELSMPGRLTWTLRPVWGGAGGPGLQLTAHHPLLMAQAAQLNVHGSGAGWALQMGAAPGQGPLMVELPAAWLAGLGAPWNTLQPSGRLQLRLERLHWRSPANAAAPLDLALHIQMTEMASRISTLPVLGDYELQLQGGPTVMARLSSRPGSALQLEGQGRWTPGGPMAFQGQAWALAGREEALSNLLNIIGRRDGARSLMAFGPPGLLGPQPATTQ